MNPNTENYTFDSKAEEKFYCRFPWLVYNHANKDFDNGYLFSDGHGNTRTARLDFYNPRINRYYELKAAPLNFEDNMYLSEHKLNGAIIGINKSNVKNHVKKAAIRKAQLDYAYNHSAHKQAKVVQHGEAVGKPVSVVFTDSTKLKDPKAPNTDESYIEYQNKLREMGIDFCFESDIEWLHEPHYKQIHDDRFDTYADYTRYIVNERTFNWADCLTAISK